MADALYPFTCIQLKAFESELAGFLFPKEIKSPLDGVVAEL